MSTKKDAVKRSTTTKKPATSSNRENSTDRRTKKLEPTNNVKKKPKEVAESAKKVVKESTSKNVTKTGPKRAAPTTPTSNRASKSQFFPNSKAMIKNVLQEAKIDVKVAKKPAMKTVLKPKQQKLSIAPKKREIVKEDASSDTSSVSERPRTATLRRPSIVNHNIVGPDAPKPSPPQPPSLDSLPPQKEENYDEDFDSYESDFEAYSSSTLSSGRLSSGSSSSSTATTPDPLSTPLEFKTRRQGSAGTDDEKKLDSGTFDMAGDYKHKQILDNIKESIEKENGSLLNPASLSDEGFEDGKSLQYINFRTAQKKSQHGKSVEMKRKRGEQILGMIRLDTFTFTLLDMPPVAYDDFIRLYGKTNNVQTSVQTGEDNVDEEVQTDRIECDTKWTQFPAVIEPLDFQLTNFWSVYKSNYLGVGGDAEELDKQTTNAYNAKRLEKFILSAGQLVMKLQTEAASPVLEFDVEDETNTLPFSRGCVCIKPHMNPMLENCRIEFIAFCERNVHLILSVHVKRTIENALQSIISMWDLNYSIQEPKIYLVAHGVVKCCGFLENSADIVCAGLVDGSISVWNLSESFEYNNHFTGTLALLPSFTTEVEQGHRTKVVGLRSFQDQIDEVLNFTLVPSKQILSLDEDGELINWNIYTNENSKEHATCLTQWGGTILVQKARVSLRSQCTDVDELQCTDLIQDPSSPNHIFVSTNQGFIINYSLDGNRTNVKRFITKIEGMKSTCLEMCPYSGNYFLAGFCDGNVSLYSRFVNKPLMILSEKKATKNPSIDAIQWSRNVSFVFYTISNKNLINVWNLSESDLFPIYSIPFKENITAIRVLQGLDQEENKEKKSYMMIGTETGSLYLHLFNTEHGIQSSDISEQQRKTFFNYVNRL